MARPCMLGPFVRLALLPESVLRPWLEAQYPQSIAMLCAALPFPLAWRILRLLPSEHRREVIRRTRNLRPVSSEVLRIVETSVEQDLRAIESKVVFAPRWPAALWRLTDDSANP